MERVNLEARQPGNSRASGALNRPSGGLEVEESIIDLDANSAWTFAPV